MKKSLLLCCSITILASTNISAQTTCGWSTPAETGKLPADVETIITQLPAGWAEANETVANLRKWFRECDGTAARKAIWDLNRALDRNKSDLAIAALLGTALLHGPEVQVEGATGVTNRAMYHLSNSERDGARLLARAAKDPRFAFVLTDLAYAALGTRHDATMKIVREALNDAAAKSPNAEQWRLSAELALVQQDYATARASGERALALGDTAAWHAIGIARIMTAADTAAARAYLAGLASERAIDLYYDDISYLLLGADTVAWKNTPVAARGEWIRKQWEWRASTSSLSLPERLKLHFTRLIKAWDMYPRTVYQSGGLTNGVVPESLKRSMSLDDRGMIYVRHGDPAEVIRMSTSSLDNTRMAWGYNGLADGRAVFEFTKQDCPAMQAPIRVPPPEQAAGQSRRGRQAGGTAPPAQQQQTGKCVQSGDYYLATPVPCQLATNNAAQATYLDYGTAIAKYDPSYAQSMIRCFTIAMQGNTDELSVQQIVDAQMAQEAQVKGMTAMRTETAGPPLSSPLSTVFRTYALRDGNATRLFGFAAIEGGDVHPKTGTSEYALRMMLAVEDNAKLKSESVDTTLKFSTPSPMRAGQFARPGIATIASPTPDATIRFTVRNDNDATQGQIITTTRAIPDYSGTRFTISDLVIAEQRDGSWVRGGIRLAPAPGHYVAKGTGFRLYHEVYGAENGDSLNIQITIAPGEGAAILAQLKSLISRQNAMQVGFSERAEVDGTGTARVMHDIGAADLAPGRYVVSVSIENGRTKSRAEARTELIIVK